MTLNPIFYAQTKYIEIDYHFVHKKVALHHLITKRVLSNLQIADILTKPLSQQPFKSFPIKLEVHPIPQLAWGSGANKINDMASQNHKNNSNDKDHGKKFNFEPLETNMAICSSIAKGLSITRFCNI